MRSDWSRIMSYLAIITPCKVIITLKHIFKMVVAQLLDVSEGVQTNKMKENAVVPIITTESSANNNNYICIIIFIHAYTSWYMCYMHIISLVNDSVSLQVVYFSR